MVGISSKLLRSVFTLTALHLVIGAILYWSMNPSQYLHWLEYLGRELPSDLTLLTLNSYLITDLKNSLGEWFLVFVISVAVGLAIPVSFIVFKLVTGGAKLKTKRPYRGLTVTIGELYQPKKPKLASSNYVLPAEISKSHKPLLKDFLNHHSINRRKQSEMDADTSDSFFQYTLDLIDIAITKYSDSLLVLVVAAHGLGRLSKDSVPYASAKTLAQFDNWWKIDATERDKISLAVEYQDNPDDLPCNLPYLSEADREQVLLLVKRLQDVLSGYQDDEVLEKPVIEKTLEHKTNEVAVKKAVREDVNSFLLKALITGIKETSFQNYKMQTDIEALGWRKGDRLYLLEKRLAERIKEVLTEKQLNELGAMDYENDDAMSPLTKALCSVSQFKNWLVLETQTLKGSIKVNAEKPLWVIRAGSKVFAGVLILELPVEERTIYPKESRYEVVIQDAYRSRKDRKPSFQKEKPKKVEPLLLSNKVVVNQGLTYEEMMASTMETQVETEKESQQGNQSDIFPMESFDDLRG